MTENIDLWGDQLSPEPIVEASPTSVVESKVSSSQGMHVKRMNKAMRIKEAPPQWVCNARKEHSEEGYKYWKAEKGILAAPCQCLECLKKKCPQLEEGPLYPIHEEFPLEVLEAKKIVGVYDPTIQVPIEIAVPCAKCGEIITLDGKTAEKFDEDKEEVIHIDCLPKEGRLSLQAVGYKLRHLLREKPPKRKGKTKKKPPPKKKKSKKKTKEK